MAPRVVVRAMPTATALLAPLLLSSQLPPLPSAAASGSPAPAPAPAPHEHRPPHQVSSSGNSRAHARRPPQPPGHQRGGRARHPPRAPTSRGPSAWWRRLNFGERFGIAIAGVAVAMQVAFAAFLLSLRARQRQRRRAAAAASRPAPA